LVGRVLFTPFFSQIPYRRPVIRIIAVQQRNLIGGPRKEGLGNSQFGKFSYYLKIAKEPQGGKGDHY